MAHEYFDTRRVCYDCAEAGEATFVPVCSLCSRFVKADDTIWYSEGNGLTDKPNATCKKHDRVKMLFEGFF